jgi:hypothetical protein
MPTVQEDLDAALNAMASLKAPMQVADNKTLSGTDRPLTAPLPDLTPTHQGEVLNTSQQAAPVLAQAESLPIKTPASLPAADTKKKSALTSSPVTKEIAAVNDTPKTPHLCVWPALRDLPKTPLTPSRRLSFQRWLMPPP